MSTGGAFLYPNVSTIPKRPEGDSVSNRDGPRKKPGVKGEFDQAFDQALQQSEFNQIRSPVKFSAHASQRMRDRKINLDSPTLEKLNDAIDKAAAKGIEESLVLTENAALIVSVKNRTVITALDREAMSGNVFTNIDGAVIV